jgi:hypothetical protein
MKTTVTLTVTLAVAATMAPAQDNGLLTPGQRFGLPAIPPGYVRVWDDDRLNPNRARGTATGEAQMNAIWTDDVPRQLRFVPGPASVVATAPLASASAPVVQPVPGFFVQIGAATNAAGNAQIAADLRAAGLPARRGEVRQGSSRTPIVLAGPFADMTAASTGLAQVQRLGYSGTILRN